MRAIISGKRRRFTEYKQSQSPDCLFFNKVPLDAPIDLWHVHLYNSQPTLAGSKDNWLALPTVITCATMVENRKNGVFNPYVRIPID